MAEITNGLNKSQRNQESRNIDANREVRPLNPEFPYRVIEFDPDFFNLPANPPKVDSYGK